MYNVPKSTKSEHLYMSNDFSINMQSTYIKLTLPKKLYQDSLKLIKEFGYSNVQDLTVESLRKQIIDLKKQQALINLKKNFGSVKARPRLSKQEKETIAERHTPVRAKEITKKYGLI